jgi:hypothetical protein
MRKVTRQIAFEPGGWTPERSAKVADLFDGLAPGWHTRSAEPRMAVVADAFARGGPILAGTWVEVGSGTGLMSPWLAARCERLVAAELAAGMIALAPTDAGLRVRTDGSRLPLVERSVDALVLINAFLFPDEARRVVGKDGVVVWVNTAGEGTPIYLSADDVMLALGPGWEAVASQAGQGTWTVARRA